MATETPGLGGYPKAFGKYQLLGPLEHGGMGDLYLAFSVDRGLDRLVVIKTMARPLADAVYVQRFREDLSQVCRLTHGNLSRVIDAGEVGDELFQATEFVEGRDLDAMWDRCAAKSIAFPLDVSVYIVNELCHGLAHAHRASRPQLVHRDVSPANVTVSFATSSFATLACPHGRCGLWRIWPTNTAMRLRLCSRWRQLVPFLIQQSRGHG